MRLYAICNMAGIATLHRLTHARSATSLAALMYAFAAPLNRTVKMLAPSQPPQPPPHLLRPPDQPALDI